VLDSNFLSELKGSDIVCVDISCKNRVTGKMLKKGAVVFDFGNNHVNRCVVGDADYSSVIKTVSALTPVPGGVGPVVIASLLKNTVTCTRLNTGI
jgi:methylenetetrahydrofolate dehydrogenase (NADP+)/methenyltetrahydrofolate cyclohydrolase